MRCVRTRVDCLSCYRRCFSWRKCSTAVGIVRLCGLSSPEVSDELLSQYLCNTSWSKMWNFVELFMEQLSYTQDKIQNAGKMSDSYPITEIPLAIQHHFVRCQSAKSISLYNLSPAFFWHLLDDFCHVHIRAAQGQLNMRNGLITDVDKAP